MRMSLLKRNENNQQQQQQKNREYKWKQRREKLNEIAQCKIEIIEKYIVRLTQFRIWFYEWSYCAFSLHIHNNIRCCRHIALSS